MTAKDALLLSLQHNLGSDRNTLVPGVNVPAFTAGTDPNQWAAQVKAIGISRLTPAGFPNSAYEFKPDYGIGGLPGYSGLADTHLAPKDPQQVSNAIANLQRILASSGEGGGSRFNSGGRWLIGNDYGGVQSASLQSASIDEQSRQAARRDALAAQVAANNAQLAQENAARQAEAQRFTESQAGTNTQLSIMDRLNQLAQSDFANRFSLSQLTGQNLDAADLSTKGTAISNELGAAQRDYSTALAANNHMVTALAESDPKNLTVVDRNGVLQLQPTPAGKMDPSAFTSKQIQHFNSPEYAAISAATDRLSQAQIAQQALQYRRRVSAPAPALPTNTMSPALMQMLLKAGGGAFPMPVVQPRTAVSPSLIPQMRPVALATPTVPDWMQFPNVPFPSESGPMTNAPAIVAPAITISPTVQRAGEAIAAQVASGQLTRNQGIAAIKKLGLR